MSKEIDEKVVSMEFDNRKFEQNVSQSMNTLDKLKEKLQFKGAEQGLVEVQNAVEKNGVELNKFEALATKAGISVGDIWQKVKNRIEDVISEKIVSRAERLVKALSSDQISEGWSKYNEKTQSVQTIMNSTGKSIDEVNGYLERLQWFSDQTSYSFTDMTDALGKFTASGADINKMIPMITGIANATAFAGQGSAEFSRVLYNLNQAYSSGYMQLMDWKSVENANVASKQLKETFIEEAKALGILSKEGKTASGVLVDVSTFNQTLSEKWLTAEVMENTFSKFSEFSEAVQKEVEATGKNVNEVIEEMSKTPGVYQDIAITAFKAAQEAKTFKEAIEATKDAVSSGWANTAELIFGNKVEATKVWTALSEGLYTLFAEGAEKRNALLKETLQSGFSALLDDEGILDSKGFKFKLQKLLESQGDIFEGKDGKLINFDELIEQEGSFEAALRSGFKSGAISANDLSVALNRSREELKNLSDEQLKELGLTREQVESNQDLSRSLEEYAEKMSKLSGRELLINGFANLGKTILKFKEIISNAWEAVFPSEGKADKLYNGLSKFSNITEKIFNAVDKNSDKIQKVFEGIFTVLKTVINVITGTIKFVFTLASKFSFLGKAVLTVVSAIGEFISNIRKTAEENSKFTDAVKNMGEGVLVFADRLAEAIKSSKFLNGFVKVLTTIWKVLKSIGSVLGKTIISFMNKLGDALQNADVTTFIALINSLLTGGIAIGVIKVFKSLREATSSLDDIFGSVNKTLKEFQKGIKADTIKKIATAMALLVGSLVALTLIDTGKLYEALKILGILAAGLVVLSSALVFITNKMKEGTPVAGKFSEMFKQLMSSFVNEISNSIKQVAKAYSLGKMITSFAFALLTLVVALKILSTIDIGKAWSSLGIISVAIGLLIGVAYALSKLDTKHAKDAKKNVKILQSIARAVTLLALSMKVLSTLEWEEIGKGLTGMSALIVLLTVAVIAIGKLAKLSEAKAKGSVMIITLALSLSLMAWTLLQLGHYKWDTISTGLVAMLGVLGLLSLSIIMVGRFSKMSKNMLKGAALVGTIALSLSLLAWTLLQLGHYDTDTINTGLTAMIGILGLLGLTVILIGRFAKLDTATWAGVAMILSIALAMTMLTGSLLILGQMPIDKIGKGLAGLGAIMAVLIVMAIAISAISATGMGTQMLAVAGALVVLAIAINLLVVPLIVLSMFDMSAVIGSIVALSVALLAFVGIAYLATGAIPGLLALGGSIALLGLGFFLVGVALSLAVGAFATLFMVLRENQDALPLVEEFSYALAAIGLASIAAGIGIGILAVALLLLSVSAIFLPLVVKSLNYFKDGMIEFVDWLRTIDGAAVAGAALLVAIIALIFAGSAIGMLAATAGVLGFVALAVELSMFIEALKPFLEEVKKIDGQSLVSVGMLAALLGTIIGAGFIGSIASITSLGLPLLGAELSGLIFGLKPFLKEIKLIDGQSLLGTIMLSTLLGTIVLAGFIGSVASITSIGLPLLGIELSSFALGLKPFLETVKLVDGQSLVGSTILIAIMGTMIASGWLGTIGAITNIGLPLLGLELSSFMNNSSSFFSGLKNIDPSMKEGVDVIRYVLDKFTSGGIFDAISKWVSGKINSDTLQKTFSSIGSALKSYYDKVKDIDKSKISSSTESVKIIASAAKDFDNIPGDCKSKLKGIGEGIKSLTKELNDSKGLGDIPEKINKLASTLVEFAENAIERFVSAIKDASPKAAKAFKDMIRSCVDSVSDESAVASFYSAGQNLSMGFANGISNQSGVVMSRVQSLANAASSALKNALKIHSPSKVFYELGSYTSEGFINALYDNETTSYDSAYDLANNATKGFTNAISKISRIIDSGLDLQPTIRPVLDLSEVTSGAKDINNLLSTGSSVGIISKFGSIGQTVDNIQNARSGNDVISAIADLKNSISKQSGDTYNINGITYDDGSEVSAAIETLIRAAKIERRR